jgi:hypothetical protein
MGAQLMLDTETLGLDPSSVITQIAWSVFDPDQGKILHRVKRSQAHPVPA